MVEEELRAEDVTNIAENDDKLRDKYKEVVGYILSCSIQHTNTW